MADQAVQLQELRQLNAELEDEIEVLLAKGAGQEQAAQVAQLEEELERLELALEGRGFPGKNGFGAGHMVIRRYQPQ